MVLNLCKQALQTGLGSMENIDSLLLMEDNGDVDNDADDDDQEVDSQPSQQGVPEQPLAWRSSP